MIYGDIEKSFRKTTRLINYTRRQEGHGTPFRTLRENTEKEGSDLLEHIEEKSKLILEENDNFVKSHGMAKHKNSIYKA